MKNDLELILPFKYLDSEEDRDALMITIIISDKILGKDKVCTVCYSIRMADVDSFEELINIIREKSKDKKVKVHFKVKKEDIKSFKIDLNSLASVLGDERFKRLELLGVGVKDKEKPLDPANAVLTYIKKRFTKGIAVLVGIYSPFLVFLALISYALGHIIAAITCILLMITFIIAFLNIKKKKVVISNSEITTYNLFKKKHTGNINNITSYSTDNMIVTAFNNDRMLFRFNENGGDNSREFYDYIAKYKRVIYMRYKADIITYGGTSMLSFIAAIFYGDAPNVMRTIIFSLGIILLIVSLLMPTSFKILDGKTIIIKTLIKRKIINISDLTKIVYEKYYRRKVFKGYINNKKVFTVGEKFFITDDVAKPLKELADTNKVKWVAKWYSTVTNKKS